jgi:hypothetical protein
MPDSYFQTKHESPLPAFIGTITNLYIIQTLKVTIWMDKLDSNPGGLGTGLG